MHHVSPLSHALCLIALHLTYGVPTQVVVRHLRALGSGFLIFVFAHISDTQLPKYFHIRGGVSLGDHHNRDVMMGTSRLLAGVLDAFLGSFKP
jgi:hypothetical protein